MKPLLLRADARKLPLADESVDCVVTSPPYWGLRDYGVDAQIGLEDQVDCMGWATGQDCGHCWVCDMRAAFKEIWRVLKPQGTVWLNLGDGYASRPNGSIGATTLEGSRHSNTEYRRTNSLRKKGKQTGLKYKDLIGQPWRLAFALQADGWNLRSDIIWHKPNPMPESVKDRPTKAHEYVFLLSKKATYYFDQDAVRVPYSQSSQKTDSSWVKGWANEGEHTATKHNQPTSYNGSKFQRGKKARIHPDIGQGQRFDHPKGPNIRSVWTITPQPRKEAHFATFPEKLVEPCILAGTSARGVCPECGKPWVRKTKARFHPQSWEPSCDCGEKPVPALVLDPFSGAGTTCRVAERLGRRAVGVELNPDYIEIAREFCGQSLQPSLLEAL